MFRLPKRVCKATESQIATCAVAVVKNAGETLLAPIVRFMKPCRWPTARIKAGKEEYERRDW